MPTKWKSQAQLAAASSAATLAADPKQTQLPDPSQRNFNQLFSGDSRFVINGSSLQIRSPSSRNDEALYVCQRLPLAGLEAREHPAAALGQPDSQPEGSQHYPAGLTLTGSASAPAPATTQRQSSSFAAQASKQVAAALYQSSSASSSSCLTLANLFLAPDELANPSSRSRQLGQQQPMMSSISIKIVGK